MTHLKIIALFVLIPGMLLFPNIAVAQKSTSFDRFVSRKLSEVVELNREATDGILKKAKLEKRQGIIGIDPFYSKVKLKYIGTPRPISASHQGLIKNWTKLQRVDKKFSSLFETEYLFKEGDGEFWIPVQNDAGKFFNEMLKSGDELELFVIYVGAQKESNEPYFRTLFLSTAFKR